MLTPNLDALMNIVAASILTNFTDKPTPFQTNSQNSTVPPSAVLAWCKGGAFQGSITASGQDAAQWLGGFVQVLTSASMSAKYVDSTGKKSKTIRWTQQLLPCYDSGDDNQVPWYNTQTGSVFALKDNIPVGTAMQDYPTMLAYLRLGDNTQPGNVNSGPWKDYQLAELYKSLDFTVVLVAIKAGVSSWRTTQTCLPLRRFSWSTVVAGLRDPKGPDASDASKLYGMTMTEHARVYGSVEDASGDRLDQLLPPASNKSANAHINAFLV